MPAPGEVSQQSAVRHVGPSHPSHEPASHTRKRRAPMLPVAVGANVYEQTSQKALGTAMVTSLPTAAQMFEVRFASLFAPDRAVAFP